MSSNNVEVVSLLPGFRQLPQRSRLQPKVLYSWKYSARRDAWAKTGPQGNSSDDDSPEISARSSCGDDDDPSRCHEEVWTLQQLDKWCGWQIPRATTAGRAESTLRPPVTKSGALVFFFLEYTVHSSTVRAEGRPAHYTDL